MAGPEQGVQRGGKPVDDNLCLELTVSEDETHRLILTLCPFTWDWVHLGKHFCYTTENTEYYIFLNNHLIELYIGAGRDYKIQLRAFISR